jgi:hypothetical protein
MPVCILQDRKNANRTLSLESSALVQRVGDLRNYNTFLKKLKIVQSTYSKSHLRLGLGRSWFCVTGHVPNQFCTST